MTEQLLAQADGIYRWPGPKRKSTLLSATLGRVVLTSERLLFLSTGSHDVTLKKLAAGASGRRLAAQKTADTSGLDLSALGTPGSLEIPLASLTGWELKGMFKVMTLTYTDVSGAQETSTFAPKNGGMPAGRDWLERIAAARQALVR